MYCRRPERRRARDARQRYRILKRALASPAHHAQPRLLVAPRQRSERFDRVRPPAAECGRGPTSDQRFGLFTNERIVRVDRAGSNQLDARFQRLGLRSLRAKLINEHLRRNHANAAGLTRTIPQSRAIFKGVISLGVPLLSGGNRL